jgi:transcriptional regulator with GAF, ATPase, and Fis domain
VPAAQIKRVALGPEDEQRREELIALLRQHGGNVAAVARVMGKARMQVHRWLKRYELDLDDFR